MTDPIALLIAVARLLEALMRRAGIARSRPRARTKLPPRAGEPHRRRRVRQGGADPLDIVVLGLVTIAAIAIGARSPRGCAQLHEAIDPRALGEVAQALEIERDQRACGIRPAGAVRGLEAHRGQLDAPREGRATNPTARGDRAAGAGRARS